MDAHSKGKGKGPPPLSTLPWRHVALCQERTGDAMSDVPLDVRCHMQYVYTWLVR